MKPKLTPDTDVAEAIAMLNRSIVALGSQNAESLRVLQGHDEVIGRYAEHLVRLHEAHQANQQAIEALADRIAVLEHRADARRLREDSHGQN